MPYTSDILIIICMIIACAVAYHAGTRAAPSQTQTIRNLLRRLNWYREQFDALHRDIDHLRQRHPIHKIRTVYEEVMQTDVPITPEQARIIRSYASRLMQVQENAPPDFC